MSNCHHMSPRSQRGHSTRVHTRGMDAHLERLPFREQSSVSTRPSVFQRPPLTVRPPHMSRLQNQLPTGMLFCSSPAISAPFAHLHPSICASSMARRGVACPLNSCHQMAMSRRLQLLSPGASLPWGRTDGPWQTIKRRVQDGTCFSPSTHNAQNIACAHRPSVLPIMPSSQAPSDDLKFPPSIIRAQGYGIRTRANTQAEVAPRLPRPRRSSSTFANFARPPQPPAAWSLQGLGLLARSSPRREERTLYT